MSPQKTLKKMTPNRVLAIDPGYDRLGLAVIEGDASRPTHIWSECVIPEKGSPSIRLAAVFCEVQKAIKKHKPNVLAIETLFFSVNKKTALGVAEARGAVLAAAGVEHLLVAEYSPAHVKLAVTGHGGATKEAIARMIPRLLSLPEKPKRLDDELDAIALGIAALAEKRFSAEIDTP